MKNIRFFSILVTISTLGILAGCASVTPLQPGAANVVITENPISKNCQWRGKVSATNQAGPMSFPYQHSSLKEDEFNRLRNQAAQLGANTVLLSSSSGMTQQKHWHSKLRHKKEAAHVFAGNAYLCP